MEQAFKQKMSEAFYDWLLSMWATTEWQWGRTLQWQTESRNGPFVFWCFLLHAADRFV